MPTRDVPTEQASPPRDGAKEPSSGTLEPNEEHTVLVTTTGLDGAPSKVSGSPQPSEPEAGEGKEEDGAQEQEQEEDEEEGEIGSSGPSLPNEPPPSGPPLPAEPVPEPVDDGWDCQWDPSTQAWFFHNRYTGKTQWDNPRIPNATTVAANTSETTTQPQPPTSEQPAAGGYNPAIHGDYDPNAWYAKGYANEEEEISGAQDVPGESYTAMAQFNRFTGQFQSEEVGPGRHTDDAKSRRQMNAYFDVDAAANAHDGRSLKAERSNKKPSKSEVKQFKEKRRARKEEKRRAWLRD